MLLLSYQPKSNEGYLSFAGVSGVKRAQKGGGVASSETTPHNIESKTDTGSYRRRQYWP
jgi:hypothetical protein